MRRSDSRMASSARRRSVTSNAVTSDVACPPKSRARPVSSTQRSSVPVQARLVAEAGHRRGRRLQDAVADDVVGIRVEAIEEGALDEVGRGRARQRARRLVRVADAPVVDDEDGGRGPLEDGAELLLAGDARPRSREERPHPPGRGPA